MTDLQALAAYGRSMTRDHLVPAAERDVWAAIVADIDNYLAGPDDEPVLFDPQELT